MAIRGLIPSRRRVFRCGLIVVAACGASVAVVMYDDYRTRQAWAAACAAADLLDPGWRWDDLVAALPPISEGRNSADHVVAAAQLFNAVGTGNPRSATLFVELHASRRTAGRRQT